ncbi:MAG TPA: DUF1501 domain-containing protein [Planctomycetaceae bacterium]|nr:hypothetical protein [Blastopirellula sp.]HAY78702.1 DUF1501 domain-containing protein [Planctomycetaceae bacterium]
MARQTRRQFLRTSVMAGGAGLSLGDVLQLRAANGDPSVAKDTAVIQIWLGGGPSQFETFDPKPDTSEEIRGPYSPIATRWPGVSFCEMLPKTAQIADKTAIIRSVSHTTNGHFVGAHWLSTGYIGENNRASRPSVGSVVSHLQSDSKRALPPYVLISEEQTRNPNIGEVMGAGHLGARHEPFTILQDPFQTPFDDQRLRRDIACLKLADDVTLRRVDDRKSLLARVDRLARGIDRSGEIEAADEFNRAALNIITSGKARQAFDLTQESAATLKLYGQHRWGKMALLARRLVESGVSFVTINTAPDSLCWDWHLNIVNDDRPADGSQGPSRGMDISGPPLDQMITALVTDIYQRGLDKKVLLVVWGEFGRTPRVNKTGGRDHWGSLMSILMAGGGLKVNQVIGSSSKKGEVPTDRPVAPTDVLATVYRHLGINTRQHTLTPQGRPIPILPDGEPIRELI